MIIIHTANPSPRLKYVLDYLFTFRNSLQWQWSHDFSRVSDTSDTGICYTDEPLPGCYWIKPCGLLEEKGINPQAVSLSELKGEKVLFRNEGEHGFDLFGAIFYCLSRYEEYGVTNLDQHGRYPYQQSFLWKHNCLQVPLVDRWVNGFRQLLRTRPGLSEGIGNDTTEILPTIDIDAAYAYKGRSLPRQLAGFAKSALQMNGYEFRKRFSVLSGNSIDPNDNFDYQTSQLEQYHHKANYFIQIGKYGRYDKNIPASDKGFRDIIRNLHKKGHTIGLHPSYDSNSRADIIGQEKEILESIIETTITCTRQHYLRFRLPETYRVLASLGFNKEFSMGYSEVTGFRAGTSRPFLWYDIEKECTTGLEIIPFSVMDVAYKQFGRKSVAETIETSGKIKHDLMASGGIFAFVFHNESLSNHRGWEGWDKVFESWLRK